jgi:predicted unusual protein kinase regulating ubiquinone biosynthesis (AarF/ABC1/UbiB family)
MLYALWQGVPDELIPQFLTNATEFEREPLATASIGQVYRACLKNDAQVIVKVRRPGIRATVEADLRLLKRSNSVKNSSISPPKSSSNCGSISANGTA